MRDSGTLNVHLEVYFAESREILWYRRKILETNTISSFYKYFISMTQKHEVPCPQILKHYVPGYSHLLKTLTNLLTRHKSISNPSQEAAVIWSWKHSEYRKWRLHGLSSELNYNSAFKMGPRDTRNPELEKKSAEISVHHLSCLQLSSSLILYFIMNKWFWLTAFRALHTKPVWMHYLVIYTCTQKFDKSAFTQHVHMSFVKSIWF